MPTCAIYARVSTDKQGDSVEHQISLLKSYVKRNGRDWTVNDSLIYEDDGISGTSIVKRPAVQRMISDAKRGMFDVVLFKGISRMSRNLVDAIHMLGVLRQAKIRVISFEENYDSSKSKDDFIYTIHAAVAQHESEKIGIRVRLGQFELAKKGKWVKGSPPIGYDLDRSTKTLIVNESERKTVEIIFDLYVVKGLGMKLIARHLNEHGMYSKLGRRWSQETVRRVLSNEAYIGKLVYGETFLDVEVDDDNPMERKKVKKINPDKNEIVVVENTHQAIINETSFNQAQKIIRSRHNKSVKGSGHLLTGLLVCPNCGDTMIAQRNTVINSSGEKKEYLYYTCKNKFKYGASACNSSNVNGTNIESAVVGWVVKQFKDLSTAEVKRQLLSSSGIKRPSISDMLFTVDKQLADTNSQIVNANLKNTKGVIDDDMLAVILKDVRQSKLKLESERLDLQRRLNKNEQVDEEIDEFLAAIERAKKLDTIFDRDAQEARILLRRLIKRIDIKDKRMKVSIKFPIKQRLTIED